MTETFLNGRVTLHAGDCLELLATLPENSIDSCVTDPPYLLTSIVKRFGEEGAAPAKFGTDGRFKRLSGGFMNKKWDAPDIPAIDPGFAYWMAGFIDGEGCFHVHKKRVNGCETYDCQFSMTLRADDKDIVVEIQKQLGGIGSIADRPPPKDGKNSKPQVRYCVSSQRDCWRLREVLSVFPLRAKKARDFEIWSAALDAWIAHEPGKSWEDVAYFRDALMAVRRYGADFHPAQLWSYKWARQLYRVLKPGAHLIAFGGTRTYHRMACAIEDAGFEIRDQIQWLYGSGFPKSHDVSKGIDRTLGVEREMIPIGNPVKRMIPGADQNKAGWEKNNGREYVPNESIPATDAARQWQGWGTALKPANEPMVLARKPLSEPTVAANVLKWGTGAINVEGCRVKAADQDRLSANWDRMQSEKQSHIATALSPKEQIHLGAYKKEGRWPANVIHDGSEEVVGAFPDVKTHGGGTSSTGFWQRDDRRQPIATGDEGSAVRFFYQAKQDIQNDRLDCEHSGLRDNNSNAPRLETPQHKNRTVGKKEEAGESASGKRLFYTAKADTDDRLGSKHPTVKPLDLIQYLVRLVTPKGGTCLDLFAGTGTTGEAAWREGMRAVLIERESEYQADIRRRMALCLSGPDERARESVKARTKDKPIDHGPLFGGVA